MAAQSGDDEELRRLLNGGYRYAFALTRHQASAEDLLQDAWVSVLQARGPRNRGYLFTAIRSKFLNRHRRERLVSLVSVDDVEAELAQPTTATEDEWAEGVSPMALEQALAQLRPIEREAMYLAAVEDYTAQEIADLTSQPRGTVLSLIFRARQKLRRALSSDLKLTKSSP